jgi:hypothetical protein
MFRNVFVLLLLLFIEVKDLYSIMPDCYVQTFGLSLYLTKNIVCLHYYVESHKFLQAFM